MLTIILKVKGFWLRTVEAYRRGVEAGEGRRK